MRTLIVLLPAPGSGTTDLDHLLTADGRGIVRHASAPAALLPLPSGTGAEVVAVVPATALSWHRVDLPRGAAPGTPRLRAVLEGMLEEKLLDEPDALHFAVEPRPRAGAPVWVAACDRAWLRGWLQALEAAGRPAGRIVPEFAPEGAPALHAIGEPDRGLLVLAGAEGVTVLPLAAASLPLFPAVAEDTRLVAEPAVAQAAERLLDRKFELQQAPQRWLAAAQTGWDLAQFDLASSGRARTLKRLAGGWSELLRAPHWRPARWAAVLLVAINLVGLNAWAWKERAALQGKREAVQKTLTTTFPQVKVVVDAPVQMERELTALRQATGAPSGRDMETMLGALGAALPPGRPLAGFDYANGELRVRGLQAGPGELAAVAQNLKGLGYAAVSQGDVLLVTRETAP